MARSFLFCFFVCVFGRFSTDYQDVGNKDPTLYDYVIVGGGGAGAVLANKLSANGARTLLLEQGDDVSCSCDQQYPFQLDDSQPYIKPFLPTPQGWAVNRENPFYEFTGLGGSTRIYGATYTRASKEFLNSRFPAGFQYNDLLPYYKQMEDHFCYYLDPVQTGISAADCVLWHGKNGPMQISPPTYNTVGDVAETLLTTASYIPSIFGTTNDYNGDPAHRGGLSYSQQFRSRATKTDANSARQSESTYSTYLPASVRARSNLVIETSARVVDLLIQQSALLPANVNRVRGVEYLSYGRTLKRAWAKQKVFVAAGVIGTPKLLQLAGIGPASLLSSLGISVVANNSDVGANLRAHHGFFQAFKVNQAVPLSSYWNAVQGRISSGFSTLNNDIQLELLEGLVTPYINVEISGPSLELSAPQPWKLFQFVVSSTDNSARGSVKIQSRNNLADPQVDLGWTEANFDPSQSNDTQALMAAMALVRGLVNAPPFATTFAPTELEIPEYKAFLSANFGLSGAALDQAADNLYLRYSLTHIYHVTSSVSLGAATDLTGAVKGVKGLHVCDNSLLPANPDANPTATMIAVCSKIAQAALLSASPSSASNSGSGSVNSGSVNSGSSGSDTPWWSV